MTQHFAFIDESGNHDLETEKSGASNYFIVLAVLTNSEDVTKLRGQIDTIRINYFGKNNEIKSNLIKDPRRLKIIEDLKNLNFKCYAVAIKKDEIYKDSGLQFKKSFIKYSNNRLYDTLFHHFHGIEIFADGHGGSEFTESFKKYIKSKQSGLFADATLHIVDSKMDSLVQLADFMVGTIAKVYENRTTDNYKDKFFSFIKEKCIRIDEWPHNFHRTRPISTTPNQENNEIIRSTAINKALIFLQTYEKNYDKIINQQCLVLNYLLFKAQFKDENGFTSTHELVTHLQEFGFQEVNDQYLRSNLIAKLRDSDVLISSSSNGYKIPTSFKDILTFVELVEDHTTPLLTRLSKARESISLASAGKMDILSDVKFKKLKNILESSKL